MLANLLTVAAKPLAFLSAECSRCFSIFTRISIGPKHIIPLIAISLSCSACITISGESSGDIQDKLQQSYLVQSAKRFYPNGTVPDNPALVSHELTGNNLKPIQKELSEITTSLRKLHETKKAILAQHGLELTPKISSRVAVVNNGSIAANTRRDGLITVDVRVLQSIFRGAVLEMYRASENHSPIGSFARTSDEFDDSFNPSEATTEQRKALESLLKTVQQIDEIKGKTMLGDLVGAFGDDNLDGPWFQISEIAMDSNSLQTRHVGAVLFLLAHEQGHLALDHFTRRDSLESDAAASQQADKDFRLCQGLRQLELEADAYALLLLSPHTLSPVEAAITDSFDEFRNIVGFRNFLNYGYNLSGFSEGEHTTCQYETNRARYENLDRLNKSLSQASASAFDAVFEKAISDSIKTQGGNVK